MLKSIFAVLVVLTSHSAFANQEVEIELIESSVATPAKSTFEADSQKAHAAWVEKLKNDPAWVDTQIKKVPKVKSNRKIRCVTWGLGFLVGGQFGTCRSRNAVYALSTLSIGLNLGIHAEFLRFKFPSEITQDKIRMSGMRSAVKFGVGIEGGSYEEDLGGGQKGIRMFGIGTGFEFTPAEIVFIVHLDKIRDLK
ncbi:MAG: hypothetical protein JNL01_01430 [Bdellovibrionales bacterium]|nr:hypothetical protein [Bdellovibrionales bacterium]